MDLNVTVKTKVKDLIIDFIEVINAEGKSFSLSWDESFVKEVQNGFQAQYKKVNFDDKYAPESFADLMGMRVNIVGLYSEQEGSIDIDITEMDFELVSRKGKIQNLTFANVYQAADNDKETNFRDNLGAFIEKEATADVQELLNAFSTAADDDSGLLQLAYDFKPDISEGELNPFTEEQKQNEDYGVIFDDWYDCLVEELLIPILKRTAYKIV